MRWWQRQRLDNLDTPDVATLTARILELEAVPDPEILTARISELETRAATSYSDAFIAALIQQAKGTVATPSTPLATGALETCVSLVGRCFAGSTLDGPEMITSALTPAVMMLIGRSMIRRGEVVFRIDVDDGMLQLQPAMSHSITGGPDPRTWQYLIQTGGPSESVSVSLPADSVVHCIYASEPDSPYRGVSPLTVAYLSGQLSANTVASLRSEASGPVGSFLPLPGVDGGDETLNLLKTDVGKSDGKMSFVESMADSWESGGNPPSGDWKQMRYGPTPPASMVELAQHARLEVYSACGIPPGLFIASAANSVRESWRMALAGTIEPIAKLVIAELQRKLDPSLTISFDRLRASDEIMGRARAFAGLVNGGMEIERAVSVSGLLVANDE